MEKKDVAGFYDQYTSYQQKTGINGRHRTIFKRLKKAGLRPDSRVLEIGCGIGTVTGLIAGFLSSGRILGTDISPKSIEIAKERLGSKSNVEFLVSDMSDFSDERKFDIVVLPDVLEHIPVAEHKNLFARIRKCMHENSVVAINIPNPYYQDWLHKNKPELLQVIDQAVYTDQLLQDVYANDLYLFSLESYCLFSNDSNYQWIILKPNKPYQPGKAGKVSLAIENFKTRF